MTRPRSHSAGERPVRRIIPAKSLGVLLSVLLGCQAPPPPPAPAPPPEPPPPSVPSVPNPVGARWSFTVTETTCIAHASNPAVTLTVRVGNNQAVLSVMAAAMKSSTAKANAHAQLRFKGSEGSWTTPARTDSQHAVTAYLHLNDTAMNNILLLLGGGRLQTEVGKTMIPVLRVPDSDVSGREWFGCVRREVGRSAPEG
jgi:hypothetical protein